MKRTAVLNVVGLAAAQLTDSMPHLREIAKSGSVCKIVPSFPAVTCTAQSNYLTGRLPNEHGIVANGWYNRSLAEVQFWKQSNHLVEAPKIWDDLRQAVPGFTCAKLFWWYNMYSSADYSITPRPLYPADGRKVFDIYTWPFSIRHEIKRDLGEFPFPAFWGPAAGANSGPFKPDAASRWIAESAKWIEEKHRPTLSLVYLPHLDYNLQRRGPDDPSVSQDLRQIDAIVGDLAGFYESRSVQVIILSEYTITDVNQPVHLNREFRKRGWLAIKDELGLEFLDCGASKVFAVADHQAAHVYLNDHSIEKEVVALLERTDGVEQIFRGAERAAVGLAHSRAGDLVVMAKRNAWFTYYYWENDALAPDFARTVDIHRKPGYDPVELFLDPAKGAMKLRIASKLFRKKLGFRMLMDIIPLDASLVRGSHGRIPNSDTDYPILMSREVLLEPRPLLSTDVYGVIRRAVFGQPI